MKVLNFIDTFMYNDISEKELLLAKLETENCERILKWVIIENSYTFQGKYKGLSLKRMLDGDERFDKFRTKILIIEVAIKVEEQNAHDAGKEELNTYKSTMKAFSIEHRQRIAAYNAIIEISNKKTCVIISDLDEMIELCDKYKLLYLTKFLASNSYMASIKRKKYIYDIDNAWSENECRYINIIPATEIEKDKRILARARSFLLPLCVYRVSPLAFEYSFVMDYESILVKLRSYSHVLSDPERSLEVALILNTKPYEELPEEYLLFEKTKIDNVNSPLYVMENQDKLRTALVSRYYKNARILGSLANKTNVC